MKVTLNWLKQYVDFDWSPEELTERLTMLGLEVEGVEKVSGEFEGVVVAQVLTKEKHPNADKLSLCRVNDGKGERQIVCGAQNFKPGDKVPLILPGASLPPKEGEAPFTIKVGKIRGVESHGMMCAPQEFGLSDEVDFKAIRCGHAEASASSEIAMAANRTASPTRVEDSASVHGVIMTAPHWTKALFCRSSASWELRLCRGPRLKPARSVLP